MNVLVLNSGSSSLKFQIIATDIEQIREAKDQRLCRGEIEGIGGQANVKFQYPDGAETEPPPRLPDVGVALQWLIEHLTSGKSRIAQVGSKADIHAVGHRVVHGGERFKESVLIDDGVIEGIKDCVDLAPLHNPDNLKGILAAGTILGKEIPQVAVFDTAFHQSLPECAYIYAIPFELYEKHRIRRYGFHGTSHRYIAARYAALRGLTREQTNIVSFHLGNGCSAAAIQGGKSIDTSMGLTPLEGLVMGSRSGDLDPSILGFLARREGTSPAQADELLNKESGLLGISGMSNDMRELQKACANGNRRAQLAIDIFCYRARKYLGAYMAAMGGADAIVFTGGIGENSAEVRARICEGLEWAGLCLDTARNQEMMGREGKISTDSSKLSAYAIPTDEELLIAQDTVRVICNQPHPV